MHFYNFFLIPLSLGWGLWDKKKRESAFNIKTVSYYTRTQTAVFYENLKKRTSRKQPQCLVSFNKRVIHKFIFQSQTEPLVSADHLEVSNKF